MRNETARWGQLERLRPTQIEEIQEVAPIAYVPWGAIEWHSYHNPVGLDGMQAHGQCIALAKVTGGIVLPPFYVGTDTIKPFKGFGHTIEHSTGVVRSLGAELLDQLDNEGWRVSVVVTGHCGGGHTDTLTGVVDEFNSRHEATPNRALLVPSFEPVQDEYPSNHAALGETSLQLLFDGSLVDLAMLPKDREPTLDEDGVWGHDPRRASAERGQEILDLFVTRVAPRIEALLNQHR